jgi:hypothetical protein
MPEPWKANKNGVNGALTKGLTVLARNQNESEIDCAADENDTKSSLLDFFTSTVQLSPSKSHPEMRKASQSENCEAIGAAATFSSHLSRNSEAAC